MAGPKDTPQGEIAMRKEAAANLSVSISNLERLANAQIDDAREAREQCRACPRSATHAAQGVVAVAIEIVKAIAKGNAEIVFRQAEETGSGPGNA